MSLPLSLRARLFVGCAALFIVAMPREAAAQAKTWHRIGTVTTQTANQLCYTNGTDIVCDSNAPTLSGTSIGIGTTTPGNENFFGYSTTFPLVKLDTQGQVMTQGVQAALPHAYNTAIDDMVLQYETNQDSRNSGVAMNRPGFAGGSNS